MTEVGGVAQGGQVLPPLATGSEGNGFSGAQTAKADANNRPPCPRITPKSALNLYPF